MKYNNIVEGVYLDRPNRFIANILIDGKPEKAHIKNTGRCRELLLPGAKVYLEDFTQDLGRRKLPYSLIAVEKKLDNGESLLINIDSAAPNKVVFEALLSGTLRLNGMSKLSAVRPEAKIGESRLDFYINDVSGRQGYIEVKGVTLEKDGIAAFPDAPTERGIKHINELIRLKNEGYNTYLIFVIQMGGMKLFTPNWQTHPQFADALKKAYENGIKILVYDCIVKQDELVLNKPVKI